MLLATANFPLNLSGVQGDRTISAKEHLIQRSTHLTQGSPVDATLMTANTLLSKAEDRLHYLDTVISQKERHLPVKGKSKELADYRKERADLVSQAYASGEAIIRDTAPWATEATGNVAAAFAILRTRVGDFQRAAHRPQQAPIPPPPPPPPRLRSASIGGLPPPVGSASRPPQAMAAQPPPPPRTTAGLDFVVNPETGLRSLSITAGQNTVIVAGRPLTEVTVPSCNALLRLVIEKDNATPPPPATEDATAERVIAEVYKNDAEISEPERQAIQSLKSIGAKRLRLLAALVLTGGMEQATLRDLVLNYHQQTVFRPEFEKFLDKTQKDLSQEVRSIQALSKKIPTAIIEPEALRGLVFHMCAGKPALERAVLKTSKFPTRGELHEVNKKIKSEHIPPAIWKRFLKSITSFFSGGTNGIIGTIILSAVVTPLLALLPEIFATVVGAICAAVALTLFTIWLVRKIYTAWQKRQVS